MDAELSKLEQLVSPVDWTVSSGEELHKEFIFPWFTCFGSPVLFRWLIKRRQYIVTV